MHKRIAHTSTEPLMFNFCTRLCYMPLGHYSIASSTNPCLHHFCVTIELKKALTQYRNLWVRTLGSSTPCAQLNDYKKLLCLKKRLSFSLFTLFPSLTIFVIKQQQLKISSLPFDQNIRYIMFFFLSRQRLYNSAFARLRWELSLDC